MSDTDKFEEPKYIRTVQGIDPYYKDGWKIHFYTAKRKKVNNDERNSDQRDNA